jgi:hypothetical protein
MNLASLVFDVARRLQGVEDRIAGARGHEAGLNGGTSRVN